MGEPDKLNVDRDDDVRPVLDDDWFEEADAYVGDKLVRSGRDKLNVAGHVALAESIVDSEPVLATYAACEWAELHDDGKVWIAAIVAQSRSTLAAAPEREAMRPGGDAGERATIEIRRNPADEEWDECPACKVGQLDTGFECDSCGFDAQPLVHLQEACEASGDRMHPSGLYFREIKNPIRIAALSTAPRMPDREAVTLAVRRGFATADDDGRMRAYYGGNWIYLDPSKIADAIIALIEGRGA